MLKIDFKKCLVVLKNLFLTTSFIMFFVLISVKYKIFQLKKNIREIQENIVLLEKEKKILDLEIVYLSNPNRLKKLYAEVQKMNIDDFKNKELADIKQIKDIKNLIPYYYEKAGEIGSFIALNGGEE